MSISVTVSGEDSTSVILSSVLTESVSISEDSSVDVVASSGNSATITVSSGDPISITGNYSNFVTGQVVRPPEITDFLTENQINTKITTAINAVNEVIDSNTLANEASIEGVTNEIQDNSDAIADNTSNINDLTGVTGSFVLKSPTASAISAPETEQFYPASNPSGFITGVNLSSYIQDSETGSFYATSNPSGFITGIDLSSYTTENFVTGVSGFLQIQISSNYSDITGIRNTTGSFVLKSETGSFISDSETGQFYSTSNPSGFITGVDLSSYVQSSETGVLYPTSNPSGFITGVDLSSYIQDSETGAFYPASNPSGFITGGGGGGGDVSTGINVTGLSTVGKITLSEFSFEVETGSFSLGSTHNGATVLLQNAAPITVTVPSQVSGYTVTFISETINSVTFASGVGLSGFNSFNGANRIAGIYGQAQIIFKSSDYAFLGGNVV